MLVKLFKFVALCMQALLYASTVFGSAPVYSQSHNINTRLNPVSSCISGTPEHVRPEIEFRYTIEITDIAGDGVLDQFDIQPVLDRAASLHKQTGNIYRIILNRQKQNYYLSAPIFIDSGVFLHGPAPDFALIAGHNFSGNFLVKFKSGASNAGVNNIKLVTNYRARSGAVYVGSGSSSIFIYDNTLQDETVDGSGNREKKGSGTGVSMIQIGTKTKNVFIDGNYFTHIPTGIKLSNTITSNIHITHNTFSHWRQRAIFLLSTPASSITDIHINNNRINDPKTGSVRQPIATQSTVDYRFVRRISINYNNIYSPDLPHIWEYRTNSEGVLQRYTMLNNATPDVISLHYAHDFNIIGNCIFNSGEVGITAANKSRNGLVHSNYIYGADTGGIAIGAVPQNPALATNNVNVINNTVVNAGRNRDNTLGPWARTAIGFTNAHNNFYTKNTIIENDPRFDGNGNPISLYYAYYDYKAYNNIAGGTNRIIAPTNVLPYSSNN